MTLPLELVLVWHMHQPDYRDHATGEATQPWVYLHAIKDYTDMAWHLEHHPDMHAVVNLVPVLLDQIEDYCAQFASGELRSPLLRLLAHSDAEPLTEAERALALKQCLAADHRKLIDPFPPYKRLHDLFQSLASPGGEAYAYLSDQFFYDLLTWYHLTWTGESVRRGSELVARLMAVGGRYTRQDRISLLNTIAELMRELIPRYRRLAESGRIELSTTPQHHPLAPLLLDFRSALDAEPGVKLPDAVAYAGGRARVNSQLEAALQGHADRFGVPVRGVWPAEGAISPAYLGLLGAQGVAWTASGEAVLANSLRRAGTLPPRRGDYLYRPYRMPGAALACFFRDDRLSDLIGFEYSKWHGRDAAANFIGELEKIASAAPAGRVPLVSVILDGENAWEHYPYNGYYFLSDLYESIEAHAGIRSTTFSAWLDANAPGDTTQPRFGEFATLVSGSWVYGSFSTWIGSPDKNRAWDLLCAAKTSFDHVLASGRLSAGQQVAALRQLADCEGSDWFWWPGDYNPDETVAAFEQLFRAKLANLYRILGLPAPPRLAVPFSRGAGHPEGGGAMRRAT